MELMPRALIVVSVVLFQCFAIAGQTPDRLEGRWAGTVDGLQGKQSAVATFKKDGDKYTGSISGLRPGMDAVLKDIKLNGDKVTAKTEIETPQGSVVVNYDFVVEGDSLKGKGEAEFGGQTYGFDFDLKRGGEAPAGQQPPPPQPRREVPQPQQKQSLTYFVGQWSFNWVGRESALGPGPREGTTTFTLLPDGKSLDVRTEGKSDGKAFAETAAITFDEATKKMTFSERLASGIQIQSKADWSSPISIRFTVDPIKVKGQTLLLKRIIAIVAAHSFTVTEELSENGGPFVRLGSAIYTRVAASK
jgi:hypothetical protein